MTLQKRIISILFVGIFSPFARAATEPYEMPFLNLTLPASELNEIRLLQYLKQSKERISRVKRLYRGLDVDLRILSGNKGGHYIPAFENEATYPTGASARLVLNDNPSLAELDHELLHHLVDRALLAENPHETVHKKRSFRQWRLARLHDLTRREAEASDSAERHELRLLLLEERVDVVAHTSGLEAEILFYLFRNQERLGLERQDLDRQFGRFHDQFRILLEEISFIMIQYAHLWDDRKDPDLFAPLQLRLKNIHKRADEIHFFLKEKSCALYLGANRSEIHAN